jgi:hypothetical protein
MGERIGRIEQIYTDFFLFRLLFLFKKHLRFESIIQSPMMFKKILFLLPSFFAMTAFAQSDFTSGVKRNDANYKKIPLRATNVVQSPLALSASLKSYAPKAGNQAQLGTCLAWAMTSSLTIQEARLRKITNKAFEKRVCYAIEVPPLLSLPR